MLPAGFKPAIPASEQPQTQALDRAALCTFMCYLNMLLTRTKPTRIEDV